MDTRPKIEPPKARRVLSANFDASGFHFGIGLEDGFRLVHAERAQTVLNKDLAGGVGLVQMLDNTNYIALVVIWDAVKDKAVGFITCKTPVRAVRLTRDKIVVVVQNSVEIYAWNKPKDPKELDRLSVYETADNLLGMICMSAKLAAFPGRTPGHVQIVENDTGNVSIIPAHSTPLRAMAFSPKGELLATASDHGTIIRIWNTRNCARICELRRGWDSAAIFSLAFSSDGNLLACTSDKGTLHVFDVPDPEKLRELQSPSSPVSGAFPCSRPSATAAAVENGKGKWGFLGKIPFMPRMFSDQYSFASAPFEMGDEPTTSSLPLLSDNASLGTTKPQKGVLAWFDEETIHVVGAGLDARWEKFKVELDDEGHRRVRRVGWKRYCNDD
ncbi:hypothetical protein VSDG_07049 [Cytospora chrysosperma]|uniref:Uncharacterized protein n=1 Tax=Cytospora chrysosperma TaxID=252740 RepID=A0A423VV82_CYTCH|nr:hypothetical protein VSDG_07049 [Valsa sordida]